MAVLDFEKPIVELEEKINETSTEETPQVKMDFGEEAKVKETEVQAEEVKKEVTSQKPYGKWLKENVVHLKDLPKIRKPKAISEEEVIPLMKAFGYTREDLKEIIAPMADTGKEPIGAMGNDTPHAILSDKPQVIYNYFKQLFAQVTNPPIDPIREGLVMALTNYIGSVSKNMLEESPLNCRSIKFESPIVNNTDLGKIKDFRRDEFTHVTIPMVFPADSGGEGLKKAVDEMCHKAEKAVDDGMHYILLSDRDITIDRSPVPSLLAVAAIHHHLIKKKKRMQIGLIVETGEAHEVMHFALLLGFGASVINPYVSFGIIDDLVKQGKIKMKYSDARENYIKAINKGLLKILSKMGISTLRSYLGAQIFEAVGISKEVIDEYFTGVPSKIGGVGMDEIAKEYEMVHKSAYEKSFNSDPFDTRGAFTYRKYGEKHGWNPDTIGLLQWATSRNDYNKYKEFSRLVEKDNQTPLFIRGFMKFKDGIKPRIKENSNKALPDSLIQSCPCGENRSYTIENFTCELSLFAYSPPRSAVQIKQIRDNSNVHVRGVRKYLKNIPRTKTQKSVTNVNIGRYISMKSRINFNNFRIVSS